MQACTGACKNGKEAHWAILCADVHSIEAVWVLRDACRCSQAFARLSGQIQVALVDRGALTGAQACEYVHHLPMQ